MTMGRFNKLKVAEGVAYIGFQFSQFNGGVGGQNLHFSSNIFQSLILSTDENESCYLAGYQNSNSQYIVNLTISPKYYFSNLISLNMIIPDTIEVFTDASSTIIIKDMVKEKFINIDVLCPEKPYQLEQLSNYTIEYNLFLGQSAKIFPLKPSIKYACPTSTPVPQLFYWTNSVLPNGIMLNSYNGELTIDNTLEIGKYEIALIAQMQGNFQMQGVMVVINIINIQDQKIKAIASKLKNQGPPQFVDFSDKTSIIIETDTLTEFLLPQIEDPDQDTYEIKISYGEAGVFTQFKKDRFIFKPTNRHAKANSYVIKIKLTDNNPHFQKSSQVYTIAILVKKNKNSTSKQQQQSELEQNESNDYSDIDQNNPSNTQLNKKQEAVYSASLSAISMSREGILKLKVISEKHYAAIINQLNQHTLAIYHQTLNSMRNKVNYTITNIKQNTISLQLIFEHPEQISISQDYDQIEIEIINPIAEEAQNSNLRSLESGTRKRILIKKGFRLSIRIPPQMDRGQMQTINMISQVTMVLQYTVITANIVLNIFLSAFLSLLWSLLNDMSSLTLLSLISLNIPGTVQPISKMIISFVYLDIFFADAWFLPLFEWVADNDKSISPYFDELGFTSMTLASNLGSGFIFLIVIFAISLVQLIASQFSKKFLRCKTFSNYLDRKLKWDFYIRFFIQQYQPLLISTLINLQSMRFTTFIEAISSLISIAFIPTALTIIILIVRVLQNHQYASEFYQQFNTLTEKLSTKTKLTYWNWNVLQITRWTLVILILVFLKDHTTFQIQLLFLASLLFQMIIILKKPFEKRSDNVLQFINEILISIYLILAFLLTDFIYSNQTEESALTLRNQIGWALLSVIFINAAINLGFFLFQVFIILCLLIQRKRNRARIYQGQYNPQDRASNNQEPALVVEEIKESDDQLIIKRDEDQCSQTAGKGAATVLNEKTIRTTFITILNNLQQEQQLQQYSISSVTTSPKNIDDQKQANCDALNQQVLQIRKQQLEASKQRKANNYQEDITTKGRRKEVVKDVFKFQFNQ